MKRIVICADGTWNKPEENLEEDYPTNVLQFARAIAPFDAKKNKQIVFYDWGLGSYHSSASGGAFGKGIDKNIQDCYRFIVHNYDEGDELFFFGFSRGAYTVRSLCGLINNCSILKGQHANRIIEAYELYKDTNKKPSHIDSIKFRADYAVADKIRIDFLGVWDTVGALGMPISFFGLVEDKHLFHDQKIGSVVKVARHALSIDEQRKDFEPTLWEPNPDVKLEQVWFAGVHTDVGGGYPPDLNKQVLANIPMAWMRDCANEFGLSFESYFNSIETDPAAEQHEEYKRLFKVMGQHIRVLPQHTSLHSSVKQRHEAIGYYPNNLKEYVEKYGWGD